MTNDYFDTQDLRVYQWLMDGNSITTLEAMNILNIASLTKRISDLIQYYHVPIHKERVRNSSGKGFYKRYSIITKNIYMLKGLRLADVGKKTLEVIWQRGSEPDDLIGMNLKYE